MTSGKIHIGTQGFSYKDWLGNFYPQFLPPADFLKFYTSKFDSVEIDSTFYRIPTVETVEKWAGLTPEDFVFSAKFPQTVTHDGDLQSRLDDAAHFVEVMRHMKTKLGVLLLQFPYSFKPDRHKMLTALMDAMPKDIRVSVELRNRKWLQREEIFEQMRSRKIGFCLVDHPWMPRVTTQTADFVYVRFLGDRKKIEDNFSYVRKDREKELRWWGELIEQAAGAGRDIFAYFNNHYSGHAPSTAYRLMELLGLIDKPAQS